MTYTLLGTIGLAAFFVVLQSKLNWRRRTKGLSLPPSRKGWPLLGNVLDFVAVLGSEWEAYEAWGKELGSDIVFVDAAGKGIVVLNSQEVAEDLLDKASATFSCRPRSQMVSLLGWEWALPLLVYGPEWRARRRVLRQFFPPGDLKLHGERLPHLLQRFLVNALERPDLIQKYTKEFVGSLMFSCAYGIDLTKEPHYHQSEEAIGPLSETAVPGRFMVDVFPWLRHVPAWVPGAGFQERIMVWREAQHRFRTEAFHDALRRRHIASLVSMALPDGIREATDYSDAVRDAASMFYAAGTETTASILDFLLLALMYHPEVQRRAQDEIDAALPNYSLPTFQEVSELPYLNALVNEILRWQPVNPIGVPHAPTADYIYKDYFIPKGSIMIANTWAMSRAYPEPEVFRPERFLHEDGTLNVSTPDPREFVFGFGRRSCPEKHLGLATLFTTAAAILLLFDVCRPEGEEGARLPPLDTTNGLARGPKSLKTVLRPRSAVAKGFLERLASDQEA